MNFIVDVGFPLEPFNTSAVGRGREKLGELLGAI